MYGRTRIERGGPRWAHLFAWRLDVLCSADAYLVDLPPLDFQSVVHANKIYGGHVFLRVLDVRADQQRNIGKKGAHKFFISL